MEVTCVSKCFTLVRYYGCEGGAWLMMCEKGKWYCAEEMKGATEWSRLPQSYLAQQWYNVGKDWFVIREPHEVLNDTQYCFYRLAFQLLPHWERSVLDDNYSAARVKEWSHHGATRIRRTP